MTAPDGVIDLKISGGVIIDGTGAPGFVGDIGITGDRIVAVGDDVPDSRRTIDAAGRVVCPGFVDIHTHYDAQLFWDPLMTISPFHGVTTAVIGNCGFGVAPARAEHHELLLRTLEKVEGMPFESTWEGLEPLWDFETFPEYLDAIERRVTGINVCALMPHTTLRIYVLGEEADRRAATSEEVERMADLVEEAMAAGAWGFSTSNHKSHIGYQNRLAPSVLANFEEYRALIVAMARSGRGTVETTRGEVLDLDAMVRIMEESGRPITLSALMADEEGKGSHVEFLRRIEAVQDAGYPLYPQVSPRPITLRFTLLRPNMFSHTAPGTIPGADFLDDLFDDFLAHDAHEDRLAHLADPTVRRQFRERTTSDGWAYLWQKTEIAEHPDRPELNGTSIAVLAEKEGVAPSDALLDVGIATDLSAWFALTYLNGDEVEVAKLLQHPGTRLGVTDGGAHVSELNDACYPTHVLAHWVRELGALSLEQAIWMMSGRSAEVYGIADRGRIAAGAAADVVVFDPETVATSGLRRVFDLPGGASRLVADAIGIDHVIVNGRPLLAGDHVVADALPGRLLRGGANG